MTSQTDRLSLPLLAVAQAQKEMTHNEALALVDTAVQATVVAVAPSTVPTAPTPGQCWIVGSGATGAWAGHDGAIAAWTQGGWRFVAPFEGLTVWSLADAMSARRTATAWVTGSLTGHKLTIDGEQVVGARGGPISAPSGGTIVDAEARTAVAAILATLRSHGLITT